MKGGFINPPNRQVRTRLSHLRSGFNEGRVYKPAELRFRQLFDHRFPSFNEGRVYKPAEPEKIILVLSKALTLQ